MDRCPPELWAEICAFACTDDGRTGRSLSLVSRFFNESSKLYKLQSITVIGFPQITAFADLLERTPPHLRRVKCIFLSVHAKKEHSRPSGEEQRRVIGRVLCGIAPSVLMLHYLSDHWLSPAAFVPVSMPKLEELVIHTQIHLPEKLENVQFVSLRHFTATSASGNLGITFNLAIKSMPNLMHLAVRQGFGIDGLVDLVGRWKDGTPAQLYNQAVHLQEICIYLPFKRPMDRYSMTNCKDIMTALESFAEMDDRIVLLNPPQTHMTVPSQTAFAMWAARRDRLDPVWEEEWNEEEEEYDEDITGFILVD